MGDQASALHRRARLSRRAIIAIAGVAAVLLSAPAATAHGGVLASSVRSSSRAVQFSTPIRHVVFLIQENHSFDNVLGAWCAQTGRCDGATTGLLYGQTTPVPLTAAGDHVVQVIHSSGSQTTSIDGGKMDGFSRISGCTATKYKCYTQYKVNSPSIANVLKLANSFAVSDRTFEDGAISSWGMHLEAVAGSMDGFNGGGTPGPGTQGTRGFLGDGWGCDSGRDASWVGIRAGKLGSYHEPTCIPDYALNSTTYPYGGAYKPTDVLPVPTIMDSLNAAGLTWRFYGGPSTGVPPSGGTGQGDSSGNEYGYGWAICPTFAACLYGSPGAMVDNTQFATDAGAGTLPNFSVVTPTQLNSQHNGDSMAVGDNWISSTIGAVENGPDWSSTAIFITWDDCGCFYDHVNPPSGLGIRVPMVIVSPYAIAGHTDSNKASYASVLAFTESVFGLNTIGSATFDVGAYNYMSSFNFSQTRLQPVKLTQDHITPQMLQDVAASPPDPNDTT